MEMKDILKEHADAVEAKLGEFGTKTAKLTDHMASIERKLNRSATGGIDTNETWGAQVATADETKGFASYKDQRPGSVRIQVKAITTDAASSGGLITPQRDSLVGMPQRRLTVRGLLNVIRVSSGTVEHARQKTRDNQAAPVAESNLKPESAYAWELVETPTRTIAHWTAASRQVLDDAPQLQDIIDSELRYGLALEEEAQLLFGDGVGQNLTGIVPQATAYADPLNLTAPNEIDTIAAALLQADLNELPADGIVVHTSDWTRMRLLKDAQERYILGDPGAEVEPRLFGRPVVPTPAMTAGDFLVGSFGTSATLYDRMQPTVMISTEHADFFVRNMVAILAEERIGLAVKRAAGFIHGSFAA